jgi:hypothetical protein
MDRLYESRHHSDDGRGEVRDPEHDRRLRSNRGVSYGGTSRSCYEDEDEDMGRSRRLSSRASGRYEDDYDQPRGSFRSRYEEDDGTMAGGQGRVRDPEHDHRLKQNRGR